MSDKKGLYSVVFTKRGPFNDYIIWININNIRDALLILLDKETRYGHINYNVTGEQICCLKEDGHIEFHQFVEKDCVGNDFIDDLKVTELQ